MSVKDCFSWRMGTLVVLVSYIESSGTAEGSQHIHLLMKHTYNSHNDIYMVHAQYSARQGISGSVKGV